MMKPVSSFGKFFLILFVAALLGGVLPAVEEHPPVSQPKIALVLSGGAALGFAHVGFLRVLEAVGIPIDMIIGNSMGSLVAALYAAGYSPGDIEAAAAQINWAQVFLNEGADRSKGLLEAETPFFTFAFDHTGKGDSKGIFPDQNITLLLSRLVYRVSMREHFSTLPLPFKTVAVDIAHGITVPLEQGPLYRAMRASMSIPLVFPPVPMNGTYLVDGALLDNNPVDLAVAWGADIIIDVDVGSFVSRPPGEINTIGTVTDQTIRLIQSSGMMSNPGSDKVDYRLAMDLSDFFWTDFAKAQQLIDRGEKITRSEESMHALLALAEAIEQTRPLEKQDWRRTGTYQDIPEPVFTQVRLVSIGIDGLPEDEKNYQEQFSPKYLHSLFDIFFNVPVDFAKLEVAIEIVRRRGTYESVGYHLEQDSSGEYVLVLTGVRSPERKNNVSLTLSAESLWGKYSQLGMAEYVNFKFRDLFATHSLVSLNASYEFSDTQGPGFSLMYTQRLSSLFSLRFAGDGAYYASTIQAFQPKEELSTFGFVNAGTHMVFTPTDFFDVYVSYRYAPLWYQNKKNDSSYHGDLHLAGFGIDFDTVNIGQPFYFTFFYNMIWRFSIEFPFAGNRLYDGNTFPWYERLELYARKAWIPRSNRNFISDINLASYRGELESRWTLFTPVGKNGIPGYSGEDLWGRDKFLVGFTYLEEITPLSNLFSMRSFFALTIRGGNVWQRLERSNQLREWRGGIRAGLQIETPIGTVFFGPEYAFDGSFQFCIYYN
ncbi:MAG: patatin-like phospholipase family protein [Treponema sp.]|jgi:NTE family protein|nr:patatin-like phospholipase family protein [Treponema sp.]